MRRLDGKPQARRTFRPVGLTKRVRDCTTEELQALAQRIGGELAYRFQASIPVNGVVWEAAK